MKNHNIVKTARGESSRKKILETTRILIGKSDSNSVTLDQIADKCKISKSSILWHFGSKEALFIKVIDTVFHRLEEAFLAKYPADLTPFEKFKHFLHDYESLLDEQPEIPIIFFSFVFNNKTREKIEYRIRDIYIQNRAAFIQQLDISENMAAIIVGMLNGIVIQANVDPKRINIKEVFNELISFLRSLVEKN
ncbi:MAG: TetR/AcrR family transcriptional regulator [Desulfobacteraceae bacterium]|nr:TetR/AcrR family transcriptional regulator [Desulfobacteraceae bacterium]MBC2756335.1 TetR/AcrR family transcriptional regulator [Desulfobacteraceae bacterium]